MFILTRTICKMALDSLFLLRAFRRSRQVFHVPEPSTAVDSVRRNRSSNSHDFTGDRLETPVRGGHFRQRLPTAIHPDLGLILLFSSPKRMIFPMRKSFGARTRDPRNGETF